MASALLKNGSTDSNSANQERSETFNRANGRPEKLGTQTQLVRTLDEHHPSPIQGKTTKGKDVVSASKRGTNGTFSLDEGRNNSLTASSKISKNGGVVKIGNTGVKLEIPPDAFQNDDEEFEIQIKILPSKILHEEPKCFEDHTTTMVEILPNKLQLKKLATLTLPHCLIVRDEEDCEVEVFQSHHTEGQKPCWEDITASSRPEVSGTLCKLMLKEFSWIRFIVDGRWVEGKKLFIYTLGEKMRGRNDCVTALVGWIPALPEHTGTEAPELEFHQAKEEYLQQQGLGRYFVGGHWQPLIFKKRPDNFLKVSVDDIISTSSWISRPEKGSPKIFPYKEIEQSVFRKQPFTFLGNTTTSNFPTCHFKVADVETETTLFINLKNTQWIIRLSILDTPVDENSTFNKWQTNKMTIQRGVAEELEEDEPENSVPRAEPMEVGGIELQPHAVTAA